MAIVNMKPQKTICSTCVLYEMANNPTPARAMANANEKIIVEKLFAAIPELSRVNMTTKLSVQIATPIEQLLPIYTRRLYLFIVSNVVSKSNAV